MTSRIASLWKKVEDSKKKVPKEKDSKVWISKGKVIPESERAMMKPDEKQRELINKFQANQKAMAKTAEHPSTEQPQSLKPRSKSRLSIRLSKFSLTSNSSKKDLIHKGGSQTTPTTPTAAYTPAGPISSHLNNGDSVNGNWATPAQPRPNMENESIRKNCFENDPKSEESSESMSTGTDTEANETSKTKRMSRLGTFLNPTAEEEEKMNGSSDDHLTQLRPSQTRTSNRSPSAIVTPFNYNPPADSDAMGNDKRTLKSATTSKIAMAVRRNDSYVNSMGRLREQAKASQPDEIIGDDQDTSHTSSVVVTLV